MTSSSDPRDELLKRVLHTVRAIQKQPQKTEEPIAIVGMACRFPGGCDTPEKYWEFLIKGGDGIREVPSDRFDIRQYYDKDEHVLGKMYLNQAGFLQEDIAEFDAKLFEISPREAIEMDPRHRMLLELSWHAFENAGIVPDSLRGSKTGVFIGLAGNSDYRILPRSVESMDIYAETGCLANIASGRIAHFYGFHGPAITIDTACSSTIVCLHVACESLQRHEIDVGLVGSAALMISPETFILLCRLNALAKDGRSKTFDASADGYGRGEGGGVVILKRLSDAMKNKDPILAVIKATVLNHDGHSSGLTVPNGIAQQMLLREALEKSKLTPDKIDYFEAHGTGTKLGDPIEFKAIEEVYGKSSRQVPLYLGAVKANVGHLEAAAGMASLIKAILCIKNKRIPPQINFHTLNPLIKLDERNMVIPRGMLSWDAGDKPQYIAISSFSFNGTNGHTIISSHVDPNANTTVPEKEMTGHTNILTLSAKTMFGLKDLATQYMDYLVKTGASIEALCYSANSGRTQFESRLALLALNKVDLVAKLQDFLDDGPKKDDLFVNTVTEDKGVKSAFIFRDEHNADFEILVGLYQENNLFRQEFDYCSKLFQEKLGFDLAQNFKKESLNKLTIAHLFCAQYALAKLWMCYGVNPSILVAEKNSHYVVACLAGVLALEVAVEKIIEGMNRSSYNMDHSELSMPQINIFNNSMGLVVNRKEAVTASYWKTLLNSETHFENIVTSLQEKHGNIFFDMGSNLKGIELISGQIQKQESSLINLRKNSIKLDLAKAVAKLFVLGIKVIWEAYYEEKHYKVAIPTYPLQRKPYWIEVAADRGSANRSLPMRDPLIAHKIVDPLSDKIQFEFQIGTQNLPEIKDNANLLHVGYYLQMIVSAIQEAHQTNNFILHKIDFLSALIIGEKQEKIIYLIFEQEKNDRIKFEFYSRLNEKAPWDRHAKGEIELTPAQSLQPISAKMLIHLRSYCQKLISFDAFYRKLRDKGMPLGKSVQFIDDVWVSDYEALAHFKPASEFRAYASEKRPLPAGIWDAAMQVFHAALPEGRAGEQGFRTIRWEEIQYQSDVDISDLWCHIKLNESSDKEVMEGRFQLFNNLGQIVAQSGNCVLKALSQELRQAIRNAALQGENPQRIGANETLLTELMQGTVENRQELLSDYLKEIISSMLKMSKDELSSEALLNHLGMDSLVALEFITRIQNDLGMNLPLQSVIEGPSVKTLTKEILALASKKAVIVQKDKMQATFSGEKCLEGSSQWMVRGKKTTSGEFNLFCFPYGGGSASLYKEWQQRFSNAINVYPIQLPGREDRVNEKPIEDIHELVDTLERALSDEMDKPFALYGHSVGGLIAYCLSKKLRKNLSVKNNLRHLFLGAYTAPQRQPNPYYQTLMNKFHASGFHGIPTLADLEAFSDAQLEAFMKDIKVTLDVTKYENFIKNNKDFRKILLSKLLADLRLVESYHHNNAEAVLDIPITVFHGESDDRVSLSDMQAWETLTSQTFKSHVLSGNHFFLHPDQSIDQLTRIIGNEILRYIPSFKNGEYHE